MKGLALATVALCSLGIGCLGFDARGEDEPDEVAVIGVTPEDGEVEVEPDALVVVELSGTTEDSDVSLAMAGGEPIAGDVAREGTRVTLAPGRLLDLEHGFAASAVAPAGPVDWTFSTRPGAVEAPVDVAPGSATRAVAIDDRGEMAATWLVSGAVSATVAGSEPEALAASSVAPSIAIDGAGRAHVFLIDGGELTAFSYEAGQWSAPRVIAPAVRMVAAVGPDGLPLVVFHGTASLGISRFESGDWTVPATLPTGREVSTSSLPGVAVGAAGEVAVVWVERADDMGATDVMASTIAPGGDWATPTPLEGQIGVNSIAPVVAAIDGGFVSAWREGANLMTSSKRSPSWALSSPVGVAGQNPLLATTPGGPVLLWSEGTATLLARYDGDGGWLDGEMVADGAANIDQITAASDRLGRLFVASTASGIFVQEHVGLYRESDAGWETLLDIDVESDRPSLAVAPHGAAVLLYEDGPLRAARYR